MDCGQLHQCTSHLRHPLGGEQLHTSPRSIQVTRPLFAAIDSAPCSNTTIDRPNEFFDHKTSGKDSHMFAKGPNLCYG